MLLFDILTFILFIVTPFGLCKRHNKKYKLIYCLIAPLSCIASHSYHIIFAFIHDPYHTTSILLLYAIIVFVHIQGFEKFFYYIHSRKTWNDDNTVCDNICCGYILKFFKLCKWLCDCLFNKCLSLLEWCIKKMGLFATTIVGYIIEFIFMAGSIGLSLALLILLPISNAIDDAPSRLYIIYQASVTFFAALIAFQLLFKHNTSIFGIFIKAINAQAAKFQPEDSSNTAAGKTLKDTFKARSGQKCQTRRRNIT